MLFNIEMTMFANVNKQTPLRNSFYVFRQQGNLLHFEDILHNLFFYFPYNAVYFIISSFFVQIINFPKQCKKF